MSGEHVDELERRRGPWIASVHQAITQGHAAGAYPGAVCAVYQRGELVHLSAVGEACIAPTRTPTTPDTLYDLASLTKALATTLVAAVLVGQGKLELDELALKRVPAIARGGKNRVTVRHLLAHSSGLAAWRPYFNLALEDAGARPLFSGARGPAAVQRARSLVVNAALAEAPEREPCQAAVYSDLGFILLGLVLEQAGGAPLDALVEDLVYRPLGLRTLHFRPLGARDLPKLPIAATGLRRPRDPAQGQESLYQQGEEEKLVLGEVDDDNCFALGGVSGHAGLFGTAQDAARLGALVLEELQGAARLAPLAVWNAFATRDARTPGSTRALGWDTASGASSPVGGVFGAGPSGALGHLGFTGCSIWLDLDREAAVALLTNRTHPRRGNTAITTVRPAVHDAAAAAIDLRTSWK